MHSTLFTAVILLLFSHVSALAIPSALSGHLNINLALRSISQMQLTDCPLSPTVLPLLANSTLPAPPANLTLKHSLLGRGTQNYTCASSSSPDFGSANASTAAPTPIGALAILYDASCLSSYHPAFYSLVPSTSLSLTSNAEFTAASVITSITNADIIAGKHYFANTTTPVFDLSVSGGGIFVGKKAASEDAPARLNDDVLGCGAENGDVAWLQLTSLDPDADLKVSNLVLKAYIAVRNGVLIRLVHAGSLSPYYCWGCGSGYL